MIFDALQAARARGIDVLLADTAGRLHSQSHLMDELRKIKRVIARVDPTAPHEVLLVLDANQGQNALAQAEQFHAAIGVTGLVITKLDGTARGGIVVAIARKLALPIRFIGLGEHSEDFGRFDAAAFAHALVDGVTRERCGQRPSVGSRRMISFERVAKRYRNGREALSNVSLHVAPGEMVFLTGRSGAGKSTVLKLIALLERPTRGQRRRWPAQTPGKLAARRVPAFRRGVGRGVPGSPAADRSPGVRQRRPAADRRRQFAQGNRQARARGARPGGLARQRAQAARRNCRSASSSASASRARSSAGRRS